MQRTAPDGFVRCVRACPLHTGARSLTLRTRRCPYPAQSPARHLFRHPDLKIQPPIRAYGVPYHSGTRVPTRSHCLPTPTRGSSRHVAHCRAYRPERHRSSSTAEGRHASPPGTRPDGNTPPGQALQPEDKKQASCRVVVLLQPYSSPAIVFRDERPAGHWRRPMPRRTHLHSLSTFVFRGENSGNTGNGAQKMLENCQKIVFPLDGNGPDLVGTAGNKQACVRENGSSPSMLRVPTQWEQVELAGSGGMMPSPEWLQACTPLKDRLKNVSSASTMPLMSAGCSQEGAARKRCCQRKDVRIVIAQAFAVLRMLVACASAAAKPSQRSL